MGRWLNLRMLSFQIMGKRCLKFRVDIEVPRVMSGVEVGRRTERRGLWFKDKGLGEVAE